MLRIRGLSQNAEKFVNLEVLLESRSREILKSDSLDFVAEFHIFRGYLCRRQLLLDANFSNVVNDVFIARFNQVPLSFSVIRQICVALRNLQPW